MNSIIKNILILLLCNSAGISLFAQQEISDQEYIKQNYNKAIYDIPMRDGKTLHTIVYTPKDDSQKYPILLKRTCYSIGPYGKDEMPKKLGPNRYLMREGYIFVYQDVRGRFMSEGEFTNMTPNITGNDHKEVDESSDTYDSIDWLLKKLKNHNGKVGQYGTSYPGFYTAAAIPDAHPALVASSPQAPIADFFFDDFHHNGAFLTSYLRAFPVFGYQKEEKTEEGWYYEHFIRTENDDAYDFYLNLGPLSNVSQYYGADNFFWQNVISHPNYDEFWQKRSLLPHLKDVDHAVMTVGGLFDAEDLYGPFNIYKTLEKNNPNMFNMLVMGPWSHGDWHRERGQQVINHIYFGDSIATYFQREVETPFFNHFLKDKPLPKLPEALIYDSGANRWGRFEQWPPANDPITLNFEKGGKLAISNYEEGNPNLKFKYKSDPANPVPYRSEKSGLGFTPRAYMTDDQRHAAKRKDVLSFQTEPMQEDFTLTGEVLAKLQIATSGTDADFIVKIIDVFPDDHPDFEHNKGKVEMGGYQMLVRSEVMRSRFRDSFEKPTPLKANEKTAIEFRLQDVHHTIKKGHRLMIQVHSTWFPLFDINPQQFVENIYKATEKDFKKATMTLYGDSVIEIGGTIP